jgi:3-oxoacyl-[acyl-carrier protein] reductase
MRLKDKVAIVTGGAQGIGKAYVNGFSREGAKVVIADVDLEAAKATAAEVVGSGGEALAIKTDVSVLEDTVEMAEKTVEHFGSIDILVNNAGVMNKVPVSRGVPFYELDLNEWDKVMAVNCKGVLLCTRAVFPYIKNQGAGKIINISSIQFHRGGTINYVHYIASKAAVVGMTRALARELGDNNINVNCIAPSAVLTEETTDTATLERHKRAAGRRAIKRVEYPQDLVGTAIFLASSDSDFITGQTIVVDGGDVFV